MDEISPFPFIWGFFGLLLFWGLIVEPIRRARKARNRQHEAPTVLRGSQVEYEAQGARQISAQGVSGSGSQINIGGGEISPADETKHFLFAGTTGSGKTQGINAILSTVRDRKARAIIADSGGRALERFYRPGDLIFNPFDARSVAWSPFGEIRDDYDCVRVAKAAIPDAEGDAREWHTYAQTLLGETLLALHRRDQKSTRGLLGFLTNADAPHLAELLSGTAASMLCQEGSEKMLANTRAILSTHMIAWRYLPQWGEFSIRDYVASDDDERWLFITYREDQFDMLRNLIAMLLDLAVVEALSLPENSERQLWFVMDEVDSLAKISSLRHALTKLRKYGGRCILGLQTISQLRATYGEHEAQTLMANVSNKVILRAGDGDTAEYFSKEFGSQEIERTQHGRSESIGSQYGKSESSTDVRETRRTVLESEIAALPDLDGFLKTPALLQRIRLVYQHLDVRTDAFVRAPR